ncbi:ferredoxin reductase [Rhodococcoides trifolii]|uniref:Ferredoxin reductase n=1 Tax=Rhodococcoides trifolii TaxID=908250 RepID=A0A917G366_9NOCA|nr:FAD-dependent oxidoreductase [Rhodococcus trifolii]GGG19585.1 ferredoxin reductase [Rhodococcus trifolii]
MSTNGIVVVGDSIAGCTAVRELRALGHHGTITMVGADADGCYARPPLSKHVLKTGTDTSDAWDLTDLKVDTVRGPATALDTDAREVILHDGGRVRYDALIIATGAGARRIASPGRTGELVLRTLADARTLNSRLESARSAIVVGAGFLGMEIASVCAARGIPVTVVDVDAPLERLLGPFLSTAITGRARSSAVDIRRVDTPVELIGDPVDGIRTSDGDLHADVVVTCAGEVPTTEWLDGTAVGDHRGIGIDERCTTAVPDVYAAGDVAYLQGSAGRTPFWSSAVAQGKVAAASALGVETTVAPSDDYFWTEVLGLSVKVVGPLPLIGEPTVLEGSVDDGSALLEWTHTDGPRTLVTYGIKKSVGLLRRMAAEEGTRP